MGGDVAEWRRGTALVALQGDGHMECSEIERLLSEGPLCGLDTTCRMAVIRHLGNCERCRARWRPEEDSQWLREVLSPLRAQGSVRASVMARLSEVALDA
jgi:hypothetical protein